ncbi:Cytochrome c3 [uncultured archaeon]|nr:Cytochrome c3 [uncultured archaeon]
MEKKYRRLHPVLIIGILILSVGILLALNVQKKIEDPQTCNLCHEMKPFVASYLKPEAGSTIAKHKLGCLGCHTNTSLNEAKSAVLKEIEIGAIAKITGVQLNTVNSALAINCTRCHIMNDIQHLNAIANLRCKDCHWAHEPVAGLNKTNISSLIPYGPHKNQTCQNCHGTTFVIPSCVNCHSGHGGQKLNNSLCLECHTDPHVPKKPGILPYNTVKFSGDLPFSVCHP